MTMEFTFIFLVSLIMVSSTTNTLMQMRKLKSSRLWMMRCIYIHPYKLGDLFGRGPQCPTVGIHQFTILTSLIGFMKFSRHICLRTSLGFLYSVFLFIENLIYLGKHCFLLLHYFLVLQRIGHTQKCDSFLGSD